MWNLILTINSALLALSALFFVNAVGAAFLSGRWKEMLVWLLITAFLILSEIALGAMNS